MQRDQSIACFLGNKIQNLKKFHRKIENCKADLLQSTWKADLSMIKMSSFFLN